MGDKTPRRSRDTQPARPAPAATPENPKLPKAPPPPPAGLYSDLGVKDETQEFGDLASRDRTGDPRGVVLHRTESPSMESARNSYRDQIAHGNHVGAHYLIGENGDTSLTVPTDKVVAHVRGNKDADWKGANAWSVGIENVGMPTKLNPKGDLREQVKAQNLSPDMRARLLAMPDDKLKAALADGGYELHHDISGPQKRSNWNLVNRLATEHHLDIGTQVQAHESVDEKTMGEGEPIKEFLGAMQGWPAKIAALEAKIAKLKAQPGADAATVERLNAELTRDKATWQAVQADKTARENTQLEAEKLMDQPGEATAREQNRTEFYNDFWPRTQALNAASS
jgi:hypothetical protein